MTVRIIPILIVVAAALSAVAPAHAQEIIAVAHTADTEMAGEDALTVEGFTGGVGGTGPDASGGGSAIVIQMLQQPTSSATLATSAASSRYSAHAATGSH
ncbi:MAG: hypothetical protein JWP16_2230 [Alphaproteobacteria bacterium]|jgi:hypothetical protein|nr:hypothetical protein [Alphaproteobacteria bacterium]MDB5741190.1 hypothetical protein [Alphaproteobacteria bacterium]